MARGAGLLAEMRLGRVGEVVHGLTAQGAWDMLGGVAGLADLREPEA